MPRRNTLRRALALPLFALASCVAPPRPVAAPPAAPPVIAAAAPVLSDDWRDWPLTAGRWAYGPGGTPVASFAGADGVAVFEMRCEPATRVVVLARNGTAGPGTMAITASDGVRSLATTAGLASLAARDPMLDRLAFSRGRIVIAVTGTARLVLPAWAEIGRVVEDCRG